MLSGIVEEGLVLTERALHNLLDRLVLPLRAFGQVVGGGHIGLVVLVVMEFERFARHVRGKRVVWIGKVGQGECHWSTPQCETEQGRRANENRLGKRMVPLNLFRGRDLSLIVGISGVSGAVNGVRAAGSHSA